MLLLHSIEHMRDVVDTLICMLLLLVVDDVVAVAAAVDVVPDAVFIVCRSS